MFAIGWNSLRASLKGSIFFISLLLCLKTTTTFAQEISIFDVRNTLALSDNEPLYKDYYLNAGSVRGLRVGMIITVVRKVSLYDSYQNKSAGEMNLEVGKIKVIHVQKDLAVARDHSTISRVANPILDYDFVMLGDALDLDTMVMEGKNKSASNEEAPTSEPTAPTAAAVEPEPAPTISAKAGEPQASNATMSADLASKATLTPDAKPAPVSTLQ